MARRAPARCTRLRSAGPVSTAWLAVRSCRRRGTIIPVRKTASLCGLDGSVSEPLDTAHESGGRDGRDTGASLGACIGGLRQRAYDTQESRSASARSLTQCPAINGGRLYV